MREIVKMYVHVTFPLLPPILWLHVCKAKQPVILITCAYDSANLLWLASHQHYQFSQK